MTKREPPDVRTLVNDRLVARLLSGRNAPSILEKEALFERIHGQVVSERAKMQRSRPSWAAWLWTAGLAAAAAVLLVMWRPVPPPPELVSRGGANQIALELSCGHLTAPCRAAGSLAFELGPTPAPVYFAAFARRADGAVIWYFPSADGQGLKVGASAKPHVLERAVTLGPEHSPGHYELFVVLSELPLSRAELKRELGPDLSGSPRLRVLRRAFEVAP